MGIFKVIIYAVAAVGAIILIATAASYLGYWIG